MRIVASSNFTLPAIGKAKYLEIDTKVWTLEEALELIVPHHLGWKKRRL